MNPTLFKAVGVVTFALALYSIGVITEQKKCCISNRVLGFITLGVIFDISSTMLMIAGSRQMALTVHGIIGYTALAVMLIDTILIWRFRRAYGVAHVSRGLNLYTRLAYGWWVTAYVAGAIIAMLL